MAAKKSNKKGNRPTRKPAAKAQTPSASRAKVQATKASTAAPVANKTATQPKTTAPEVVLPFTRMNYILLLVGIAIIGFGFFLMSLDDFVDATEFSISLYIAPVVVVAGFAEVVYAIMYTPKKEATTVSNTETA